jgi:hypothetical protein
MKDTHGVLEDLVIISSLVCVANSSPDDGRSTENSRPKSCETVIPVPLPSSVSPAGGEIVAGGAGWMVGADRGEGGGWVPLAATV